MKNRVEPPILISRLMTFVLAASLVVLGVLGMTIIKMFPLNRPEVFFLTTELRDNQTVKLVEMPTNDSNFDLYKQTFVREYVRHRNDIFPNAKVMNKKWNGVDGFVRITSSDDVYSDFTNTNMFVAITGGMPDFEFRCVSQFEGAPALLERDDRTHDVYQVKMQYFCSDNTGRTPRKDYTIKIKLAADTDANVVWKDRISNPLGLRVEEYEVTKVTSQDGDTLQTGDPLDTGYLPE